MKNCFLLIFISSLLSGCVGYPRLISYPFDPRGRSINSSASEQSPHISGRFVVFSSDRRGSQDIYMFDTFTRSLIDLPGLNSFDSVASHPSATSDGRYIVLAASHQGRSDIFLFDRETQQLRNLTANLQAEVRDPTISADGSRIAFATTVKGQWDVLVYNRAGQRLNIQQDPR